MRRTTSHSPVCAQHPVWCLVFNVCFINFWWKNRSIQRVGGRPRKGWLWDFDSLVPRIPGWGCGRFPGSWHFERKARGGERATSVRDWCRNSTRCTPQGPCPYHPLSPSFLCPRPPIAWHLMAPEGWSLAQLCACHMCPSFHICKETDQLLFDLRGAFQLSFPCFRGAPP